MADKIEVKDIIDIEGITAAFKDLSNTLNSSSSSLSAVSKNFNDVLASVKNGNVAYTSYKKAVEEAKNSTDDLNTVVSRQKELLKELDDVAKSKAAADNAAKFSLKALAAEIKLLSSEYDKLSQSEKETTERGKELGTQIKKMREDYSVAQKASEEAKKSSAELSAELVKQKEALRVAEAAAKEKAEIDVVAKDSLKGMAAEIKALNAEYSKLSKNQRENTKEGVEMGKQLKDLREAYNAAKMGAGDYSSNVGRYTEGIKKSFSGIGNIIAGATGSVGAFGKALIAALANPVGLILALVAAVVAFAQKLGPVKNAIAMASSALDALGANIDKVFKTWVNWMTILWDILKGIIQLITFQFNAAMESFGDIATQFKEGVKNVKDLGNAMWDAAAAANGLGKAEKDLLALDVKLQREIDKIRDGFGKLNVVMNDTTRTQKERREAFLKLEADTKRAMQLELQLEKERLRIGEMQLKKVAATAMYGEKSKEYLEKAKEINVLRKAVDDAASSLDDFNAGANQRNMLQIVKFASENIRSIEGLNTALTRGIEKSANDATTTLEELEAASVAITERVREGALSLGKSIEYVSQNKIKASDIFDEQGFVVAEKKIEELVKGLAPEQVDVIKQAIALQNKNISLFLQINNRSLADRVKLKQEALALDKQLVDQAIARAEYIAQKGDIADTEKLQANINEALALEKKHYEAQNELFVNAENERQKAIAANGGKVSEEVKLAQQKDFAAQETLRVNHAKNLAKIDNASNAFSLAVIKKSTEERVEIYEKANNQIIADEAEKLTKVQKLANAGLISEEERARRSEEIQKESERRKLNLQLQYLEAGAKAANTTESERQKFLADIAKLKLELEKLNASPLSKLEDGFKRIADAASQVSGAILDAQYSLKEIALNQMDANILAIQEEQKALEAKAAKELELAEGNAFLQERINKRLAADKEELAKKEREEKKKAAELEKASALFHIALNTAVEVTKVMSNPVLVATTIALGLSQAAAVATRPIPAYEKGTNYAEGGLSLVGEKGSELVTTPKGEVFLTPSLPTLMNIPRGSKVMPASDTANVLEKNVTVNIQPQRAKMLVNIDKNGIIGLVKENSITRKRF